MLGMRKVGIFQARKDPEKGRENRCEESRGREAEAELGARGGQSMRSLSRSAAHTWRE